MLKLAEYLGIKLEDLNALDIEIHEDSGSSGETRYSYWFEVPEGITEELMESTGLKPRQIIRNIPISIIEDDEKLIEMEFDRLLNEVFLSGTNPYSDLKVKIDEYKELVLDHKDKKTGITLNSVMFATAIGALEAYMWEIVRWKIDNDTNAVNKIFHNCKQYGERTFKLSEIVAEGFSPKMHLVSVLNNIVWHRVKNVGPIFKALGVNLPSLQFFEQALIIRHHIVHRSGKDCEGNLVQPNLDDVIGLLDDILKFAEQIDKQLYKLPVKGVATNVWA